MIKDDIRRLAGLTEGRSDWNLEEDNLTAGLEFETRGSWRLPNKRAIKNPLESLTEAQLLERMRAKPVQTRSLPRHVATFVKHTGDVKTVSKVKDAPDNLDVYVWSTNKAGGTVRFYATAWEDGKDQPVFQGVHFKASEMYQNMKYELKRWEVKQNAKAIPHEVQGSERVDVGSMPPHAKDYLDYHFKNAVAARQVSTPKGMLIYTWEAMQKGKLRYFAAIWKGRAKKPATYARYMSETHRDKSVADEIRYWKEKVAGKAADSAAKKAFSHGYKVGDTLYSSWGYGQTNIDFYEVVDASSAKTIKMRKVGKQVVKQETGSDYVVPTKGIFSDSKVLTKRVRPNHSVKISSYANAYKWDGKPKRQTASGYGH